MGYIKLSLVFLLVVTISCTSKSKKIPESFYLWVKKGEIVSISCRGNEFNKYSLYLPKNYNLEKNYPVIFCFDPHADGTSIVKELQNYGEKHNIIIVGSNTHRNGLNQTEIQWYLKQLYEDIKEKIRIDTSKVFALGFSGGARIASTFENEIGSVSGLVLCSAGKSGSIRCIPTVFIAGNNDMNYLETRISAENSRTHSCPNCFLTFEGQHQWPPVTLLCRSIDILFIWNQSIDDYLKTYEGLKQFEKEKQNLINRFHKLSNDSLWKLTEEIKTFLSIYNFIPQTQEIKELQDSLMHKPEIKAYYSKEEKILQYEQEQQQIIQQSIGNKHLTWWKKTIEMWRTQGNTDKMQRNVSKRLLAYTSLLCYSYTNISLQQQRWELFDYLLTLYGWVDPQNPDYHFFKACFYLHNKNTSKALLELKQAFKYGMSKEKVLYNPMFYMFKDSILAL